MAFVEPKLVDPSVFVEVCPKKLLGREPNVDGEEPNIADLKTRLIIVEHIQTYDLSKQQRNAHKK
jgi:hypothetical protein